MHSVKIDQFLKVAIGVLLVRPRVCALQLHARAHRQRGRHRSRFHHHHRQRPHHHRRELRRKLLVLNFWATWCQPCVEEMPSLDQFAKAMVGSGVVVLGVSMDKNPKLYHDFLTRSHVSFMTARDPDAKISADYGTFKFPESYIIDSNGKVVQKIIGATNWTDGSMVNAVKSLLCSGSMLRALPPAG